MSNAHTDNYQFYTALPGPNTSHVPSVTTISGGKLRITSNGGILISNNLTAQGTWIVNVRINIENLPSGTSGSGSLPDNAWPIIIWQDAGTIQCSLCIRSDGKLQFYRGNTAIGSASLIALDVDDDVTQYDIEAKVVFGNSGSCACRVNGGAQISGTVDNTSTANNTADSIRIGNNGSGGTSISVSANVIHVIVMDSTGSAMNDFIGPVNVILHQPNADGNYTTWTANTGTRFGAVDDANPDGNTTYVAAASVGDKVSFGLPNLPPGVTAVKGACAWANMARDDDTTRASKFLLRSSGSDQLGSTEHFPSKEPAYLYFFEKFDLSPFTSVAWTPSEINGLEVGMQITT